MFGANQSPFLPVFFQELLGLSMSRGTQTLSWSLTGLDTACENVPRLGLLCFGSPESSSFSRKTTGKLWENHGKMVV